MEKSQVSHRNIFLDLFRYVLVFFVISIHYNSSSNFMSIFRVAVPMFFMISGFYNYTDCKDKRLSKCYNFMKSSLKYLLIGTSIYFVYDIYKCIFNGKSVVSFFSRLFYKDFCSDFFLFNISNTSGYHLWFLIALFVCSLIHYIFVKFDKCKLYYVITPILLVIVFCMNGYLHLIFDYSQPLEHYRNVVFMGLPLFFIGFLLGKLKDKRFSKRTNALFALLSFYFLIFSLFEKNITTMEFYSSSVFASAFLLLFINSLPAIDNKATKFFYKWIGKNSVFYIYILHIMVYEIFVEGIIASASIKCVITLAISFFIYEVIHLIGMLINHTRNKRKTVTFLPAIKQGIESTSILTEAQKEQIKTI